MRPLRHPASALVGYGAPPKRYVADFKPALLNKPYQGISVTNVKPPLRAQIRRYLTVLWTVGAVLMTPANDGLAYDAVHSGETVSKRTCFRREIATHHDR